MAISSNQMFDALHAFDAENPNETRPSRTIAEEIALTYGFDRIHPLVDDIAHAIEDARNIGERRAKAGMLSA